MSIQAVGWAFEQTDIPARAKFVLVAIANHADHTNGYCYLRADTIASEAACSPRAVFNFVGDLIRNGYIRKAQRKSEDGKQRANDYWILFDRPAAKWVGDRPQGATEDDVDPDQDTTSSDPHAPLACGENGTSEPPAPPENAPGAVGPHAPMCSRKSLDEPSKTNPSKKEKDGANQFASAPRKYHAPPLAPQGALHPDAAKPIFVYRGTPAWEAWMDHKQATTGIRPTDLTKTLVIDGEKRTGWWFPTLFPPRRETGKESSEEDDPALAQLQ